MINTSYRLIISHRLLFNQQPALFGDHYSTTTTSDHDMAIAFEILITSKPWKTWYTYCERQESEPGLYDLLFGSE